MATMITARTIAPVLRAAADKMAGLAYARVVRTDVHHAILLSSPQYDVGQAALDTLTAYLVRRGRAEWLSRYSRPRGREEVVAELRAAAVAAEQGDMDEGLASADQSFDWTRQLDPQVRADLTTCLEVGPRAFGFVRPVPVQVRGGES
ncbi:hypothetical protein AB0K40_18070 [Nonomuraea bangladeshensis]|uniref:Uncharacterized protein n=1 Tax=Nonomuraea bangladeshensis TaxID=404385 RepID=A0ABV3H4F0_9ACTN